VWEITGAEFTKSDIHTADGISIRFPRVTKIRDDKDWKTATDLPRLKVSRRFISLPTLVSFDILMVTGYGRCLCRFHLWVFIGQDYLEVIT